MRKTFHLILLTVLTLSSLTACSAVRYNCSMMPTADKNLQCGQVHLAMTNFTYEKPGVEPLPATIDQQAKAFLEAQRADVGRSSLVLETAGHAGKAERDQALMGGMGEHRFSFAVQWK